MADEVSYADLFAFLQRIGFVDSSRSDFERIFEYPKSGIVLAFAMVADSSMARPVRSADLVSAEFRLQQHGLLDGKIVNAIQQVRANG